MMIIIKLPYESYSASSFIRQEISDDTNDWILATSNSSLEAQNKSECEEWNPDLKAYNIPSPDIRSVSYISDGRTLNATIWLSDKFVKTPLPVKDTQELFIDRKERDIFKEQLNLFVQKLPSQNITLNQYINDTLNRYRESLTANFNLTNFKIIELNVNTTLGDNSAHKLLYSAFSRKYNIEIRLMEIWTLNGDKAFIIRYIAEAQKYDLYLPIIQKMIDSLNIDTESITRNINYTSNFLPYKNTTLGLKILYPSNWTTSEENNNNSIYSIIFSSPYEHPPLNDTLSSSPFKNFFSPYEGPYSNGTHSLDSYEDISWQGVRYVTVMDINSVYDKGSDYLVQIGWNKLLRQNQWIMRVTEQSISGGIKVLYENNNYPVFYNKEQNYIVLSFDLHSLNYPPQYRLVSYVDLFYKKNDRLCILHDPTNHVPFPPPEFDISTSPNSVTLRPGEKKDIQIRLNSTAYSRSDVFFSTDQAEGLKIKFTPANVSVSANGMVTSNLLLETPENITAKLYTLPIHATISFPREVGIKWQDTIFNNTSSERIQENSYVTLTVLPPLTPEEHLANLYRSWVSPISGIWTFLAGIAAVIAPLIINIYRKRRNKK